jgi:Family of unknown function (DUF5678)
MAARDWSQLYKKHRGQWVALEDDQHTVIVAGDDLKQVRQAAISKGHSDPIFTRVPTRLMYFVGSQA